MMATLVGVCLAIAVSVFAILTRLDRDRAFYPTVTIVVASYYGLYAVIGGSLQVLAAESIAIALFLFAAVLGFRRNLWIVAVALAAHGIFDSVHGRMIANPGMPLWWPSFCLAYDVTAAACLAAILIRSGGARPGGTRDSA